MATKLIIITDAWDPQVNGVVTTYKNLIQHIPPHIHVEIVHPGLFKNFAFPFYKGIQIALCNKKKMREILIDKHPSEIQVRYHIATEGVLGLLARNVLRSAKTPYTSAYHTKFPEFFKAMFGVPVWLTKWYFDWFHKKSKYVMCSSKSSAEENPQWNSVVLGKGYDYEHFIFNDRYDNRNKVLLYVGRVSKEKNIEAFCRLPDSNDFYNYTKVVVGDGPDRKRLQKLYPKIHFVGYKFGRELAAFYQNADVFVFPSKADTFGIVILEAMACGTPVAAYPVTGPIDQIIEGTNGSMCEDLYIAVDICCRIDRGNVYFSVKHINWANSAQQFINYIEN